MLIFISRGISTDIDGTVHIHQGLFPDIQEGVCLFVGADGVHVLHHLLCGGVAGHMAGATVDNVSITGGKVEDTANGSGEGSFIRSIANVDGGERYETIYKKGHAVLGGIAGYFGKWVDNLIMRIVDVFYCIPTMPIIIILGIMLSQSFSS